MVEIGLNPASDTASGAGAAEARRDAPPGTLAEPRAAVDRDQPLPLFLQIRRQLLALVAEWPDPERRFHTDAELAAMFGVTKATVRHALSELADSGLIRRRRGSGTFVTRAPYVERLDPGLDIDGQYAEASGQGPEVTVLSFVTRPASAAEARALQLAPGAQVVAMRRLRALAHVPLAIDERVIEAGLAGAAGFTEQSAARPIVERLRAHVALGRAAWEMSARRAGAVDAALLQVRADEPVLVRAMTYYSRAGRPVMLGETRHRSDLVRCGVEMDLGAPQGDGGARATRPGATAAPLWLESDWAGEAIRLQGGARGAPGRGERA